MSGAFEHSQARLKSKEISCYQGIPALILRILALFKNGDELFGANAADCVFVARFGEQESRNYVLLSIGLCPGG